jgi:acetate kinase
MTATWKNIIALNSGSSSIKFAFFGMQQRQEPFLNASGLAETVSKRQRRLKIKDGKGVLLHEEEWFELEGADFHKAAMARIVAWLNEKYPTVKIVAVISRVVHGGVKYDCPLIITPSIFKELEALVPLAPLHQPHNLSGVRAAQEAWPEAIQMAAFDTAFHRSHEYVNDAFAIPHEYYLEGVRKYGFHGLSYEFVSKKLKELDAEKAKGRVIVCHLGNGASMCAIRAGRSVASSMGFTAVEGLPMGTRCGNIDPGVILYLLEEKKMTVEQVTELLYKKSGLKGMSNGISDMRELEASDSEQAKFAIEYFVARIKGELGRLTAALGGLDAIVFTAGIGENSTYIREKVLSGLGWLGVLASYNANKASEQVISMAESRVKVFVIKTNEELMLAEHAMELLEMGNG